MFENQILNLGMAQIVCSAGKLLHHGNQPDPPLEKGVMSVPSVVESFSLLLDRVSWHSCRPGFGLHTFVVGAWTKICWRGFFFFFCGADLSFPYHSNPATGHCVDLVVGVFDFTQPDTMRPAHTTMRTLRLLMTHWPPPHTALCLPGDRLTPPDLYATWRTKPSSLKSSMIYHRELLLESRLSADKSQTFLCLRPDQHCSFRSKTPRGVKCSGEYLSWVVRLIGKMFKSELPFSPQISEILKYFVVISLKAFALQELISSTSAADPSWRFLLLGPVL